MSVWPLSGAEPSYPRWQLWRHRWPRAFWNRAYQENITGLVGDGRLQPDAGGLPVRPAGPLRLRPGAEDPRTSSTASSTTSSGSSRTSSRTRCTDVLDRIRDNSTTIGIAAFVGSLWIGASFWGAMDTAFCRIYHVECRGWVRAEALRRCVMLLGSSCCSSPPASSSRRSRARLVSSADNLPFGLSDITAIDTIAAARRALLITFLICLRRSTGRCPKGHMPWRAVWPGALPSSPVTTGVANCVFPFYLTNVSEPVAGSARRSASSSSPCSGSTCSAWRCWPAR